LRPVFVIRSAENRGFTGVCVLEEQLPHLWVEHLWVRPDHIGKGLGTALLEHALEACIADRHQSVKVVADPNAVPFYRARGFETIGYHPSRPGDRQLPVMEKRL
jgi:GNAT superfamily N-acetyltransferase